MSAEFGLVVVMRKWGVVVRGFNGCDGFFWSGFGVRSRC